MGNNLKQLKNQLKELKLKHLAAQFDDFMISACNGEKPNTQFLMDALEIELSERRRLSMEKRLKYAKFPVFDKPFDLNGFDFGKRQGVSKRQILELSSNLIWIDKAYNVLFLGGSGLGKSFLACYLGYKAAEAGYCFS
ncbi:MAG TPA: ATP-binding protein [Petrimonas sp.]|nr:ATP-binding protein [Petrimonas sp.]